jgi:predicted nucleotidyltransferase
MHTSGPVPLQPIQALCRQVGVCRLDLFGSRARGDAVPARSDYDFVVDLGDAPPALYAERYFTLKAGLEAMLGADVDLVTTAGLVNPWLRARIDAERVEIHAS